MSFSSGGLFLGIALGGIMGLLAFRAKALTAGGAVAAAVVGTAIFGFGGLAAAILMISFFMSSTALTRFKTQQKQEMKLGFAKAGRRDAGQVWANGGAAAACMLLYGWSGSSLALIGFVGAMAAATADTWGTEIGVLSKTQPRSILTGLPVAHGESGGMTVLGTIASAAGALAISLIGILVLGDWWAVPLGFIGGLTGAVFDSFLGARWQVMFTCPSCAKATESHPFHHCGAETQYERGWRWLDNDGVNFLATCAGAGVSVILAILWR